MDNTAETTENMEPQNTEPQEPDTVDIEENTTEETPQGAETEEPQTADSEGDDLEWFDFDEDDTSEETGDEEGEPDDKPSGNNADVSEDGKETPEEEENTKDAIIRKLRAEAARRRQQVKEEREKSVAAVEEALGIVLKPVLDATGADTVDIDEIPKQLQKTIEEARTAKLELALYRASVENGADIDQLKDSMSFMEQVNKLDPSAESFQKDIMHAVRNTIHDNPRFKQPQKITRSSGDFANTGAEPPQTNSIEELMKRRRQRRNG